MNKNEDSTGASSAHALTSLAISMESGPGIFAVLIGSGVSRVAGIKTGWEIQKELISKIALASENDKVTDPESWYKQKFNKDPDYSEILELVAPSTGNRQEILKPYFEASQNERMEGLKIPTLAHQAIARLVKAGFVRVIVTTNFDHLMEDALRLEHIEPVIVHNSDSLKGATPLVHSKCTIVKIHGDYLDLRIKNTKNELKEYENDINKYLDRIFKDFGLIICGWSATWDEALRGALERRGNGRYSAYWATRGDLTNEAQITASNLDAQCITILDADSFFQKLEDRVTALRELSGKEQLSSNVAIRLMKKYLEEPNCRIRQRDLVATAMREAEAKISEPILHDTNVNSSDFAEYRRRVSAFENGMETICSLIATGCFWGGTDFNDLAVQNIDFFAKLHQRAYSVTAFENLQKYPALLILYAAGISSIAGKNYKILAAAINQPTIPDQNIRFGTSNYQIPEELNPREVLDPRPFGSNCFKASYHLHKVLSQWLSPVIQYNEQFDKSFDQFERILFWAASWLQWKQNNNSIIAAPFIGRWYDLDRDYVAKISFSEQNESPEIIALQDEGFFSRDADEIKLFHNSVIGFLRGNI